ncbi:MAG: hypothetical protein JNJ59_26095, partial [Deltaproteobacteria bacterium]|nr:hypothetical protein [Deltaproteobacteria bacterium]
MKNEVVRTPVLPGVVLALVCLSGPLVACHDDDKVSGSSDSADADADTAEDADLVDTTEPDVSDATDAVETDGTSCTEPGGTFCPCTDNASCNSGVCVPTSAGGNVCSRTCDEVCPSGWECKPIALSGTDPTFICVERTLELCRPCRQQSDCLYPGFSEPGDRCVEVDALSGAFCGNACSADEDCPDTFACREVKSLGSDERTFQCVPESGECACSGRAVELAADTACQRGACSGRRVCEVAGLTTCSASEPGLEICDGLDNDCSGQTDEGFVDTDRDQKADCVDPDDDGDGIDDATDVCPLIADPDQGDGDGDDLGDACDPPAMPVLRATSPESPANGVAVQVLGEGERGAIVTLFDDANCTNARGEFAVVDG